MFTGTEGFRQNLTLDVLLKAMAELEKIPKNDQWLVVDPQGKIYKGTVTQVLPVLIEQHPLHKKFKYPISFQEPA